MLIRTTRSLSLSWILWNLFEWECTPTGIRSIHHSFQSPIPDASSPTKNGSAVVATHADEERVVVDGKAEEKVALLGEGKKQAEKSRLVEKEGVETGKVRSPTIFRSFAKFCVFFFFEKFFTHIFRFCQESVTSIIWATKWRFFRLNGLYIWHTSVRSASTSQFFSFPSTFWAAYLGFVIKVN